MRLLRRPPDVNPIAIRSRAGSGAASCWKIGAMRWATSFNQASRVSCSRASMDKPSADLAYRHTLLTALCQSFLQESRGARVFYRCRDSAVATQTLVRSDVGPGGVLVGTPDGRVPESTSARRALPL